MEKSSDKKKKINSVLWISVFCTLFFTPVLSYPLVQGALNAENKENRETSVCPRFSLAGYESFAKDYEKYFNEMQNFV